MDGRFEPLVPCDGPDGCHVLVEPHVARCRSCEKRHGESPNARGQRGHAISAPPEKPKPPGKPKPAKVEKTGITVEPKTNSTGWVECVGVHGRHECGTKILHGSDKRCPKCQARFEEERRDVSMAPWQKQLEKLKAEGGRR